MTLLENVRQALAGLVTNKMRSLLTMLGIIIGIGSVIAIMSVGDAMTSSVSNSLSSIGVNKVVVKAHGASKRKSICASILQARKLAKSGVVEKIRASVQATEDPSAADEQ